MTRVIDIKAELDKPLKLDLMEFNLVEKGRKYRIMFKSIPGPPQTYGGFLKLKTNYPEKPEITVRIRRQIRKKS